MSIFITAVSKYFRLSRIIDSWIVFVNKKKNLA